MNVRSNRSGFSGMELLTVLVALSTVLVAIGLNLGLPQGIWGDPRIYNPQDNQHVDMSGTGSVRDIHLDLANMSNPIGWIARNGSILLRVLPNSKLTFTPGAHAGVSMDIESGSFNCSGSFARQDGSCIA